MTIEACLCYFDGLCSISLNSGGGVCNWFFRLCVRFLDFLLYLFFGLVWFCFFWLVRFCCVCESVAIDCRDYVLSVGAAFRVGPFMFDCL